LPGRQSAAWLSYPDSSTLAVVATAVGPGTLDADTDHAFSIVMPAPIPHATEAATLLALLERIEKAALDTGLAPEEFRTASKVNAAGETVVGLVIKPNARGFSKLSIP
jgi:hypothetical protein